MPLNQNDVRELEDLLDELIYQLGSASTNAADPADADRLRADIERAGRARERLRQSHADAVADFELLREYHAVTERMRDQITVGDYGADPSLARAVDNYRLVEPRVRNRLSQKI